MDSWIPSKSGHVLTFHSSTANLECLSAPPCPCAGPGRPVCRGDGEKTKYRLPWPAAPPSIINGEWTMPPMSCGPTAMCFLVFSGNLQHTRNHVMTNPGSREDNKTHYLYAATLVERTSSGTLLGVRFLFFLSSIYLSGTEEAPASTALTTSHDGGLTALARLRWRLSTTTRLHPTDSGPSTFSGVVAGGTAPDGP